MGRDVDMSDQSRFDDIRDAIVELVEEDLGSFGIERIEVTETEDHDGDSALLVEIHRFDDTADFDPKRASMIVTKLNDRLFELGERRFAYVEYPSPEAGAVPRPAFR